MRKLVITAIVSTICGTAMAQQIAQVPSLASREKAALAAPYAETARVNVVGVNGLNCPVMASAQRGGAGAVVQTRKGQPGRPDSELKMHFSATSGAGISEASISLHGTDNKPRAELAYSSAPRFPDLIEVVHLTGSADHALTQAAVDPSRVVNVRWISITELKFVDGTIWHASQNSYCHIQPNGFHLVGGLQ